MCIITYGAGNPDLNMKLIWVFMCVYTPFTYTLHTHAKGNFLHRIFNMPLFLTTTHSTRSGVEFPTVMSCWCSTGFKFGTISNFQIKGDQAVLPSNYWALTTCQVVFQALYVHQLTQSMPVTVRITPEPLGEKNEIGRWQRAWPCWNTWQVGHLGNTSAHTPHSPARCVLPSQNVRKV
jgi:hypothetical protein